MIALSPGLAQACFELLALTVRQKLTFTEIQSSFSHLASFPSHIVVQTAQALNWLTAKGSGQAELTPTGVRLLSSEGYEAQLRQALLDYIDIERPSWVQNASFGRGRVISFAGTQIAQVFAEAGLAEGTSSTVVAFWDALAARARGQRDDRLAQIGRVGERLTIAFEEQRTGTTPRWIAIDNNADGFDVLSVVAADDFKQLTIEVKTSTQGTNGFAVLTRNEWEAAMESEEHVFHLWSLRAQDEPELAVINTEEMLRHTPCDQGMGRWDNVKIPFIVFKDFFTKFVI